ncbi:MAG: 4Fe-4S dicluster domain-containing protein [Promethearchaeota archaeon]
MSSKIKSVKLKTKDVPTLIEKLAKILQVFGPVAHGSKFQFDLITEGNQLRLDYDTTILPPKKYFTPQEQNILSFSLAPELSIHEQSKTDADLKLWNGKRFLIFGVHSCDLNAMSFLDSICNQLYQEPFRNQRRREGAIVGLYCLTPCSDSFCKSMGSLDWNEGADLMLAHIDDEYFVEILTETGQKIVEYAKELFHSSSKADESKAMNMLTERTKKFPDPISNPEKLPEQLEARYEGEMWDRLGKRCFGCGSCTMVCPTCFCFDVKDQIDLSLSKGIRLRSWDSCQLIDFALVAGGHNFRPTIPSRIRFRIYHKFRAEPEQIGKIGCVGCGRCTHACPADIEMTEILKEIQKEVN